jgi:hypothetical protein
MGNMSVVAILIITLIVFIVVFLLARELFCWYSKINERIILQQRTNLLLEQVIKQLGGKLESNENLIVKNANNSIADNDENFTEDEFMIYDYVDKMGARRRALPKVAREKGWERIKPNNKI